MKRSTIQSSIFIFLLFLLGNSGSAQPTATPFRVFNSAHGVDTIFSKNQIIVRNAEKDTLEISETRNGMKNGKQKLFYTDGALRIIAHYKNNVLDGRAEYYSLAKEEPFRIEHYKALPHEQRAVLHGLYKSYNSHRKLVEETTYKNGRKNGAYRLFYNNGVLKEKGKYEDGLNIGRRRVYADNGTLVRDEKYIIIANPAYLEVLENREKEDADPKKTSTVPKKLSVLDGNIKYYSRNGHIVSDFHFERGKKEGLNKEFYPDKKHTLKSEVVFENGMPHGAFAYYRQNGDLKRQGKYYREITVGDTIYKDVYDGEIIIYQDNGKKQRVEHWKNYKRNGPYESYSYRTGELSSRVNYSDNLKSGKAERFDKDGNQTYEAFFEIKVIDGKRVSLQTGTETHRINGKISATVEWKNGKKNGISKWYYPNGQLEKTMTFKNGKRSGAYKTYYKNGRIKGDYTYRLSPRTGDSEYVGWNSKRDQNGNVITRFYAKGDGTNIIKQKFENGFLKELRVENILQIEYTDAHRLSGIRWLLGSQPFLGFDFFGNQQLRKIHFKGNNHAQITANFLPNRKLNQIKSNTGNIEQDKVATLKHYAQEIGTQYNPEWQSKTQISNTASNGSASYEWKYADGSPFFKIQFKDSLPNGKWILQNPISRDTLFYFELEKNLPVGMRVRKTIAGNLIQREIYYPNHKVKRSYRYNSEGELSVFQKNDPLGNNVLYVEYYPNGELKYWKEPLKNSYLTFSESSDTLAYNILLIQGDSIRIQKQFYSENRIQVDRKNNLVTGFGSVKTYFENGQLRTTHELRNKEEDGVYKKFDKNGRMLTLGHFKAGKRNGQWITYQADGSKDSAYFENGEIIIKPLEEGEISCRCYDKSLPNSEIKFANLLSYLLDYKSMKAYLPESIIPNDGWDYDHIFYLHLNTSSNRSYGFTGFTLLTYRVFSFYYPSIYYLKINLTPCQTEGYINKMDFHASYDSGNKELVRGELSTKRISISLENNPLTGAENNKDFTAYFDTRSIAFDKEGIDEIVYETDRNACYSKGTIKDFLEIEVLKANLVINPTRLTSTNDLPLLPGEVETFYGFDIVEANLNFNYSENKVTIPIHATSRRMLAGSNFVAGNITVEGKHVNDNVFILKDTQKTIHLDHLQRFLEQKGFYRVEMESNSDELQIRFFAEK